MASIVSGLDRLVEAVEATEREARKRDGYVCPHPGCARVFSKRYNQQAHMRIHDGTRPFLCERCGKRFMWKSSLKSHARMHEKMERGGGKRGRGGGGGGRKKAKMEDGVRGEVVVGGAVTGVEAVCRVEAVEGVESEGKEGRRGLNGISRVDLDAATLLTMFR